MGDAHQAATGPAAFSDYRLGALAGAAFPAALLGLEARPAQVHTGVAARDLESNAAEMLYSIQLQAHAPDAPGSSIVAAHPAPTLDRWMWRIGAGPQAKVSPLDA